MHRLAHRFCAYRPSVRKFPTRAVYTQLEAFHQGLLYAWSGRVAAGVSRGRYGDVPASAAARRPSKSASSPLGRWVVGRWCRVARIESADGVGRTVATLLTTDDDL